MQGDINVFTNIPVEEEKQYRCVKMRIFMEITTGGK
jgi:hypothetical protein